MYQEKITAEFKQYEITNNAEVIIILKKYY